MLQIIKSLLSLLDMFFPETIIRVITPLYKNESNSTINQPLGQTGKI